MGGNAVQGREQTHPGIFRRRHDDQLEGLRVAVVTKEVSKRFCAQRTTIETYVTMLPTKSIEALVTSTPLTSRIWSFTARPVLSMNRASPRWGGGEDEGGGRRRVREGFSVGLGRKFGRRPQQTLLCSRAGRLDLDYIHGRSSADRKAKAGAAADQVDAARRKDGAAGIAIAADVRARKRRWGRSC